MNVVKAPRYLEEIGDAGDDCYFVLGTTTDAFYIVIYGNPEYNPMLEDVATFARFEIQEIAESA